MKPDFHHPYHGADHQGGTYSGNVVACAAALATTTYMRTHDVLGNVNARSDQIFAGLREIQVDTANGGWMIEEVRGKGVSPLHKLHHILADDPVDGRYGVQRPKLKLNVFTPSWPQCQPSCQYQQASPGRMYGPRLAHSHDQYLPRLAYDSGSYFVCGGRGGDVEHHERGGEGGREAD